MKTIMLLIFCSLVAGCSQAQPKQETIEETPIAESLPTEQQADVVPEDTTVVYNAYLDNWEEYFRENNKYKDWDKSKAVKIPVKAIIEKDGTASNLCIPDRFKDVGTEELRKEAIRLVQYAKMVPATNGERKPVKESNWLIMVEFPPK